MKRDEHYDKINPIFMILFSFTCGILFFFAFCEIHIISGLVWNFKLGNLSFTIPFLIIIIAGILLVGRSFKQLSWKENAIRLIYLGIFNIPFVLFYINRLSIGMFIMIPLLIFMGITFSYFFQGIIVKIMQLSKRAIIPHPPIKYSFINIDSEKYKINNYGIKIGIPFILMWVNHFNAFFIMSLSLMGFYFLNNRKKSINNRKIILSCLILSCLTFSPDLNNEFLMKSHFTNTINYYYLDDNNPDIKLMETTMNYTYSIFSDDVNLCFSQEANNLIELMGVYNNKSELYLDNLFQYDNMAHYIFSFDWKEFEFKEGGRFEYNLTLIRYDCCPGYRYIIETRLVNNENISIFDSNIGYPSFPIISLNPEDPKEVECSPLEPFPPLNFSDDIDYVIRTSNCSAMVEYNESMKLVCVTAELDSYWAPLAGYWWEYNFWLLLDDSYKICLFVLEAVKCMTS